MEDNEQILFDEMPSMFGKMFMEHQQPSAVRPAIHQKTYASLYEELCDKCNPGRFMDMVPYDATLVSAANEIYREILQCKEDANYQREMMHKAYNVLGVKFDGTNMYHYLLKYLDPHLYLNPYSPEELEFANKYYPSIEANKDDLIVLESIKGETQWFVDKIEKERAEKCKEQEEALMGVNEMLKNDKQWLDDVQEYFGVDNWRKYVEEEYGGLIEN